MTERKWADSTPIVPFGGLHGSGNDKTQFQRIVELERDLAAREAELAEARKYLRAANDELAEVKRDFGIGMRAEKAEAQLAAMTQRAEAAERKAEEAARDAELAEARDALQFVERWANHHGQKDCVKPEHALATIQHYPPILAITESYEDGKVPETRNPWAELAAMKEKVESLERAYASVMQAVDECGSYRP